MSFFTQHETWLETRRLAIPGGPGGWHPHRLIFRDWWLWRDHELGFAHGRLALTGQNAGGKSSLLALAIPTLLDGDTSPIRLDPALSRDRFLYWYLLGDEDADPDLPDTFAHRARIGCLALEFRHGGSGAYLTIGMCVSASRSHLRRIRDWCGFVLPDRRIGRGFDLRGADGNCLPPRDLCRLVQPPALATQEHGEYRKWVNAHLFGMEDDDYQALINMLLQARRPKLGEQSGPDRVCLLLRDSLPGVPAERLERVAEVVGNIEEYQRNLADVARRAELVGELDQRLQALAEALAQEAAAQYATTAGQLGHAMGKLGQARQALEKCRRDLLAQAAAEQDRNLRLAAINAQLAVYRAGADADLPVRLTEAESEQQILTAAMAAQTRRQAEGQEKLQQHARTLTTLADRFRAKAQAIARELDRLAEQATDCGWHEAARALAAAADDLVALAVDEDADQAEAVRPDPAMAVEGERLAGRYRELIDQRTAVDEKAEAYRLAAANLEERRQRLQELSTAEAAAQSLVQRRQDELADALAGWAVAAPALDVPDRVLAEVVAMVRALAVTPPTGAAALLEPLRPWARQRRSELADQHRAEEAAIVRAGLESAEWERQIDRLQQQGVEPERSPVRAAARTARPDLPPLFRCVRFRPEVDPETAARVEAAALEAGLLDLLLIAPEAAAAADAWALPAPLTGVPTLLAVLAAEPDAPALATQVLASIGWGEGCGPRWLAADGRWQNGLAKGQVAPWLTAAPGLVGSERRNAERNRRLAALRQLRAEAEGRRQAATERQRAINAALQLLEAEMAAAEALPWQALFGALADAEHWRRQVDAARAAVETTRPLVDAALAAYQQAEQGYGQALRDLPPARGLSREGLLQRAALVADLARAMASLPAPFRELADTMLDHRRTRKWREDDAADLQKLAQEQGRLAERLARAQAQAEALARRLRDPAVAALQAEIAALTTELAARQGEARQAVEERVRLERDSAGHETTIADWGPQEGDLRAAAAAHLKRLRQRAQLHPALAEFARILEPLGPGSPLPRVPRAVDPEKLEEAIGQRRGEVQNLLHAYRDKFEDYRPSPGPGWETVALYEDREPLTAAALCARLLARQQEYRGYIAEEEQKLYQRIIFQGILGELRRLIRLAEDFTARTNTKLRKLRLSSGERLSLRLSLLPREQVPGAGIGHLLRSVEQDSRWLPDAQQEMVLELLHAEVERVRRDARARGEDMGYADAIRLALDYRNWYQYELLSHLPGASGPSVIRSRGFGRRSTSAKAWALAVPVIAGVSARFDAARQPDIPRIIALDEAFAGFDANNQAEYLKFLSDLGLCWVITCPDELPYSGALSAAMAYRMSLEDNIHAAFPILWDGQAAAEPLADLLTGDRIGGWAEGTGAGEAAATTDAGAGGLEQKGGDEP